MCLFLSTIICIFRWSSGSRFLARYLRNFDRGTQRLHCCDGVEICIGLNKFDEPLSAAYLNIIVTSSVLVFFFTQLGNNEFLFFLYLIKLFH
jgi:hypothetical protein